MKKVLSIFLALLTIFTMLPTTVFAEANVTANGNPTPVLDTAIADVSPDTAFLHGYKGEEFPYPKPQDSRYDISVSWNKGSDTVIKEMSYTGTIYIRAKEGYVFTADTTFKGATVPLADFTSDMKSFRVDTTLNVSNPTVVTHLTIDMSFMTVDLGDQFPGPYVGEGAEYLASVEWDKYGHSYVMNSGYTGKLTVVAKSGYIFNTLTSINGGPGIEPSRLSADRRSFVLQAGLNVIQQIPIYNINFTPPPTPVAGNKPGKYNIPQGSPYTVSTSWSPEVADTFLGGVTYYSTATFQAIPPHEFVKSALVDISPDKQTATTSSKKYTIPFSDKPIRGNPEGDTITFNLVEGYADLDLLTYTITNSESRPITDFKIMLLGSYKDYYELISNADQLLNGYETNQIQIKLKSGIPPNQLLKAIRLTGTLEGMPFTYDITKLIVNITKQTKSKLAVSMTDTDIVTTTDPVAGITFTKTVTEGYTDTLFGTLRVNNPTDSTVTNYKIKTDSSVLGFANTLDTTPGTLTPKETVGYSMNILPNLSAGVYTIKANTQADNCIAEPITLKLVVNAASTPTDAITFKEPPAPVKNAIAQDAICITPGFAVATNWIPKLINNTFAPNTLYSAEYVFSRTSGMPIGNTIKVNDSADNLFFSLDTLRVTKTVIYPKTDGDPVSTVPTVDLLPGNTLTSSTISAKLKLNNFDLATVREVGYEYKTASASEWIKVTANSISNSETLIEGLSSDTTYNIKAYASLNGGTKIYSTVHNVRTAMFARISATVVQPNTSGNQPMQGVLVYAKRVGSQQIYVSAPTDKLGHVIFDPIPAGIYTLYANDENASNKVQVTLTHDTVTPGDVTLTLTGKLTDVTTALPIQINSDISNVFSPQDMNIIGLGNIIKYTLELSDGSANIVDATKIRSALTTQTLGQVLDISLFKEILGNNAAAKKAIPLAESLIRIVIDIPNSDVGHSNYQVARVHNDIVTMLSDEDNDPNTITFQTDKFSTYAITYTKSSKPGPSDGSSNSSQSSEDDFWQSVEDAIKKAANGDTINVNAHTDDKLDVDVMKALQDKGVTLVISWDGGNTITIPAGQALKPEAGRIYYPLSLLEKLNKDAKTQIVSGINPETGGDGNVWDLEAPATVESQKAPNAPITITPPTSGFEKDAFAGTPENAAASRNSVFMFAWIVAMLAAITGFLAFLRKKKNEQ
ncbi:hypothetical protein EDD70_0476 [Hydrogenoanaerobacterium saccharovorans]|uniref:Fibronectin type-III domain-containing protein n=1 Tax=Hydrogenoanaerobacterium saccharovorans TaxID=474960 RepID=A0A1H8AZ48_9FIRM|nr:fibronectin type III domain-containing protein [Hydrogenoanaerobacterium saccharovorans]RPF47678.1 hypothetical protein EDD70_0476 [Hydrogenoanaerobacterium saccharovorans]SEM75793.1 hypothetical protein SAMN05216180_1617 [Hydrogenoanaerobacterium saccharovorans]